MSFTQLALRQAGTFKIISYPATHNIKDVRLISYFSLIIENIFSVLNIAKGMFITIRKNNEKIFQTRVLGSFLPII